ncbi:hypothetical protein CA13_29060 [Planctomycetes bacterium CA13]|uniref:Uncharacterized protein n=1 Tax=Novipirellula herctigrandis TaxID=2527986 RepID=A0A5C5Z4I0_9BACT|nr:hypothetical protein CA13_29060 [Planctomycetes bacterium CA13]
MKKRNRTTGQAPTRSKRKGLNKNRKGDRIGIGYFYSDVSDDLISLLGVQFVLSGLNDFFVSS